MEKKVPIKNQMNGIFVHVSNLKNAAQWYCELLGMEVDLEKVESPVFNVPVAGSTSLTLDDHTFDPHFKHQASSNPIFNFYAPNIDEAYQYLKKRNYKIVRDIERHYEMAWFNIEDPDGNVIMICNC